MTTDSRDELEVASPVLEILFRDGYLASVDALYIQRTYLAFLEGRPQLGFNQSVLNQAHTAMERMWGRRRTHVIEPPTYQTDANHEWLPAWQVFVWLRGPQLPQLELGQSELVVVFFCEQVHTPSFRTTIQEHLGPLKWSDYAEEFECI
jgi:hypothetical protein